MSSLRNILSRCARNASILGRTPLQIQCTFNPVYSDPSCISRQSYSRDANERLENAADSAQKSAFGQMKSKKPRSRQAVPEEQKASVTAESAQKTPFGQMKSKKPRSRQAVPEEQKASVTAESAQKTPFGQMKSKKSRSRQEVPEEQKASKPLTADSAQKSPFGQMNSKKSGLNIAAGQKASKPFTADSPQKTPFGQMKSKKSRSRQEVPEEQKASKPFTADSAQKTPFGQMKSKKSRSRQEVPEEQKASKPFTADSAQKTPFGQMKSKKSRSRQEVPEEQKASKPFTADSAQKTPFGQMKSKKSRSRQEVPEEQKASKPFTADSAQKTPFGQMKSKKSRSRQEVPEEQKASKPFTADSAQKTPFGQVNAKKSGSNIAAGQKASKYPTVNKYLDIDRHYISVRGLAKETTPASLLEFYSQFGEVAVCDIIFPGESNQFGKIGFYSKRAKRRAQRSLPHIIDGKETKNVISGVLDREQRCLEVLDLSPETTKEPLKAFFSKFGRIESCGISKATDKVGQIGKVTFADEKDMHRAWDAQPHVIDGSQVLLRYATHDLDLWIENIPKGITEEALREFYSKYGQLTECRLHKRKPEAYISYSYKDAVNRAMEDRPHVIEGKPLKIMLMNTDPFSSNVSLIVGSLPENVTEETLGKEFSKYGKPIFWELKIDGDFNQSGPYGIVSYGSEGDALNALNSGPHMIEGSVVDVRKISEALELLSEE